jgi:hypothetical protein
VRDLMGDVDTLITHAFQDLMMTRRRRSTISACLTLGALQTAARLGAQSPDSVFYVTTRGRDTASIEYYTRVGNTITGAWIQHQGSALVHDYAMVLGADGWPAHYVMSLYMPPGPHTFLVSVTYGTDSATRIMVRDSTAVTMRAAAIRAYPVAAVSILAWDLALARAAHSDTASIVLEYVETKLPARTLPVKFMGGDSVRIGDAMWARVDRSGRLLSLRQGPQETRRVSSLDVARLAAGWNAADAAIRAARVEVALSPEQLQRFVGEYSLNATATVSITLEGSALMLRVGTQAPIRLFAQSPTTFFMKATTATTFEFDADAAGKVAGLTLVQGETRLRAVKKN